MFNPDGSFDERTERIIREQTIPPRYGRSPGMDACGHWHGIPIRESFIELYTVPYFNISAVATYVPKLTWRERLHVIWIDRIKAAWLVLIGKAYAEYPWSDPR